MSELKFRPDEILAALRALHPDIPATAEITIARTGHPKMDRGRYSARLPIQVGEREDIKHVLAVLDCKVSWTHPDGSKVREPKEPKP